MDALGFLKADIGRGDATTNLLVPDVDGTAYITCEQDTVVAGIKAVSDLLESVGLDVTAISADGDRVKAGTRVLSMSGSLRTMITAERTVLNILMRMSGVADITARAVEKADGRIIVAATRKTTPGFGDFEKEAVRIAGGDTHRAGLDSMIMIKDNHIVACGSMKNAMEKARKASFATKIEAEASNIEDAVTAAEMGADIVMADNCGPELTGQIRDAVKGVSDRILVEASGGIGIDDIPSYIGKADIVSLGCITHSAVASMFSMDVNRRDRKSANC